MNIDDLTLGQIKQLKCLFGSDNKPNHSSDQAGGLNCFIGKKVIIRTYSAGVFFGTLIEKAGKEVILNAARRLWYWDTADKGISLSDVAIGGIGKETKACAAVDIWLEAIEIIPCSDIAIKSIESTSVYKA
jgi:hypothetical protein